MWGRSATPNSRNRALEIRGSTRADACVEGVSFLRMQGSPGFSRRGDSQRAKSCSVRRGMRSACACPPGDLAACSDPRVHRCSNPLPWDPPSSPLKGRVARPARPGARGEGLRAGLQRLDPQALRPAGPVLVQKKHEVVVTYLLGFGYLFVDLKFGSELKFQYPRPSGTAPGGPTRVALAAGCAPALGGTKGVPRNGARK